MIPCLHRLRDKLRLAQKDGRLVPATKSTSKQDMKSEARHSLVSQLSQTQRAIQSGGIRRDAMATSETTKKPSTPVQNIFDKAQCFLKIDTPPSTTPEPGNSTGLDTPLDLSKAQKICASVLQKEIKQQTTGSTAVTMNGGDEPLDLTVRKRRSSAEKGDEPTAKRTFTPAQTGPAIPLVALNVGLVRCTSSASSIQNSAFTPVCRSVMARGTIFPKPAHTNAPIQNAVSIPARVPPGGANMATAHAHQKSKGQWSAAVPIPQANVKPQGESPGVITVRGKPVKVSPVRPQIKGKPVDTASMKAGRNIVPSMLKQEGFSTKSDASKTDLVRKKGTKPQTVHKNIARVTGTKVTPSAAVSSPTTTLNRVDSPRCVTSPNKSVCLQSMNVSQVGKISSPHSHHRPIAPKPSTPVLTTVPPSLENLQAALSSSPQSTTNNREDLSSPKTVLNIPTYVPTPPRPKHKVRKGAPPLFVNIPTHINNSTTLGALSSPVDDTAPPTLSFGLSGIQPARTQSTSVEQNRNGTEAMSKPHVSKETQQIVTPNHCQSPIQTRTPPSTDCVKSSVNTEKSSKRSRKRTPSSGSKRLMQPKLETKPTLLETQSPPRLSLISPTYSEASTVYDFPSPPMPELSPCKTGRNTHSLLDDMKKSKKQSSPGRATSPQQDKWYNNEGRLVPPSSYLSPDNKKHSDTFVHLQDSVNSSKIDSSSTMSDRSISDRFGFTLHNLVKQREQETLSPHAKSTHYQFNEASRKNDVCLLSTKCSVKDASTPSNSVPIANVCRSSVNKHRDKLLHSSPAANSVCKANDSVLEKANMFSVSHEDGHKAKSMTLKSSMKRKVPKRNEKFAAFIPSREYDMSPIRWQFAGTDATLKTNCACTKATACAYKGIVHTRYYQTTILKQFLPDSRSSQNGAKSPILCEISSDSDIGKASRSHRQSLSCSRKPPAVIEISSESDTKGSRTSKQSPCSRKVSKVKDVNDWKSKMCDYKVNKLRIPAGLVHSPQSTLAGLKDCQKKDKARTVASVKRAKLKDNIAAQSSSSDVNSDPAETTLSIKSSKDKSRGSDEKSPKACTATSEGKSKKKKSDRLSEKLELKEKHSTPNDSIASDSKKQHVLDMNVKASETPSKVPLRSPRKKKKLSVSEEPKTKLPEYTDMSSTEGYSEFNTSVESIDLPEIKPLKKKRRKKKKPISAELIYDSATESAAEGEHGMPGKTKKKSRKAKDKNTEKKDIAYQELGTSACDSSNVTVGDTGKEKKAKRKKFTKIRSKKNQSDITDVTDNDTQCNDTTKIESSVDPKDISESKSKKDSKEEIKRKRKILVKKYSDQRKRNEAASKRSEPLSNKEVDSDETDDEISFKKKPSEVGSSSRPQSPWRSKMSPRKGQNSPRRGQHSPRRVQKNKKRRSLLDELKNSAGYVAEKKLEKQPSSSLYVDPTCLSREERALQRAMMMFSEMEHDPADDTEEPMRPSQQRPPSNTTSAKNKANELKKKALRTSRGQAQKAEPQKTERKKGERKKNEQQKNKHSRVPATTTLQDDTAEHSSSPPLEGETSGEEVKQAVKQKKLKRLKRKESGKVVRTKRPKRKAFLASLAEIESATEAMTTVTEEDEQEDWAPAQPQKKKVCGARKRLTWRMGRTGLYKSKRGSFAGKRSKTEQKPKFKQFASELSSVEEDSFEMEVTETYAGVVHHQPQMDVDTLSEFVAPTPEARHPESGVTSMQPHQEQPMIEVPLEVKKLSVNHNTGETILHKAARLGYQDVVQFCADTGYVDIHAQDHAGYAALHECCAHNFPIIAKILLQHGVNVNVSSQDGTRPLHDAVENDRLELVRMLLSYGADIDLANYSGKTVFQMAHSDEMRELLHGYLADLNGSNMMHHNTPWAFASSGIELEPPDSDAESIGYEMFEMPLSDSDSELDEQVEFDFCEQTHLSTYFIDIQRNHGPQNFVLLRDVLKSLSLSRHELFQNLEGLKYVSLTWDQFSAQLRQGQIDLSEPLTKSNNVELLEVNQKLKLMLDVTTETLNADGELHDTSYDELDASLSAPFHCDSDAESALASCVNRNAKMCDNNDSMCSMSGNEYSNSFNGDSDSCVELAAQYQHYSTHCRAHRGGGSNVACSSSNIETSVCAGWCSGSRTLHNRTQLCVSPRRDCGSAAQENDHRTRARGCSATEMHSSRGFAMMEATTPEQYLSQIDTNSPYNLLDRSTPTKSPSRVKSPKSSPVVKSPLTSPCHLQIESVVSLRGEPEEPLGGAVVPSSPNMVQSQARSQTEKNRIIRLL